MNIKILDSWLREYLNTKATPQKIAEVMSLTSVSIERVEPYNGDFILDVEVTTNRPDLMSVVGLAREAAAILPHFGIQATFLPPKLKKPNEKITDPLPLTLKSNDDLVNRICAVILEVTVKPSPKEIQERLETSDIRSLNNIIDITNYVMRTIGHPTHVFDYDKLKTQTLVIREARKNEKIVTLDNKPHTLQERDMVADDGLGNIVDLLGIMGLENSVVNEKTKRILFFIDNLDSHKIRKTSMSLGLRTEAAQLNEKNVDPELAMDALLLGISLYQRNANAKLLSPVIDLYPHKPQERTISVHEEKINTLLGIELPLQKAAEILTNLDFTVSIKKNTLEVKVPSIRINDITIAEDIIEEVARVYGYHNLPSSLPPLHTKEVVTMTDNPFYWEGRAKDALKYWGMTEVYTYPMVSESLYEGPINKAVTLQNPLGEDFMYMRRTLVPSLLKVIEENKHAKSQSLFEIANIYEKVENALPRQQQVLAGVIKNNSVTFFHIKGLIEQLCTDFGITNIFCKSLDGGGMETEVLVEKEKIGEIEILDDNFINFELNFSALIGYATLQKSYKPLSKFPPIIEDLSFVIDESITTGEIITFIQKQSPLITNVSLLDKYHNSRTFHILYQDQTKNLTNQDIADIRQRIIETMKQKYHAALK